MNSHPLAHFPELHTSSSASSHADGIGQESPQLLELRTESGTFYVSPSPWQRLRLRWLFRHFHELPQQVLSRRDQRLIEKLAQAERVVPSSGNRTILGVIERPHTKPAPAAHPVVVMTPRSPQSSSRWNAPPRIFPEKADPSFGKLIPAPRGSRRLSDAPFRQWGSLGALAAVCCVVIVLKVYLIPAAWPAAATAHGSAPAMPAASRPAVRTLATPLLPASLQPTQPAVPLLSYARRLRWFDSVPPASSSVARKLGPAVSAPAHSVPESTSAALPTKSVAMALAPAKPVFVSELPQGHFAAPVPSNPNQVGELQLKALIAADGSVQDVTVVSGDPKLAAAGIRAVRRWHYNPYQASNPVAERETYINMKFFGQDAVSVTSAAR